MSESTKTRIGVLFVFLLIFGFNTVDGNLPVGVLIAVSIPMLAITLYPMFIEKSVLSAFKKKVR